MFQSTRRRLALWYTAVTAVLMLLFATGVYLYVRNTLIDRMDDTLKHVVEVVDRSLVFQPPPGTQGRPRINLEASFRQNANAVEDDRIDIEWFSPNGELLWSTFADPLEIPIHLYPTGTTVRAGRDRLLRQVTQRIEAGRQVLGYLRVSHPWFEVTKPIRQLTLDLSLGITVMVGCVAAIGWWLSGIAIEPVRKSYQSLKQFTADASHELRNPIATIQTNVQTALTYSHLDPQLQRRQLQAIERLTQRLGRLVNDLLFLARSDSGMLETQNQRLPLDALLIEVLEEQRLVAEQRRVYLSLHIVEPADEPMELEENVFAVDGDWDRLARLFTNLIGNALEYASLSLEGKGETINPESFSPEAAVEVELQRIRRDRHVFLQVQVRDTGIGIPESSFPHLFDRFYRVDPARTRLGNGSDFAGTGLGLAIARVIAENHRGQISVRSTLGQGTTFTVLLPVTRADTFNSALVTGTSEATSLNSEL